MMLWLNAHRRHRDRLSAYIDGQLGRRETDALERHLSACADCRQELQELRAAVSALRQLPDVDVPRSFALAPAQAARPAPPRPSPALPLAAAGMRLATAAAAVALAGVLVVDLGGLRDEGAAPTPAGTQLNFGQGTAPPESNGEAPAAGGPTGDQAQYGEDTNQHLVAPDETGESRTVEPEPVEVAPTAGESEQVEDGAAAAQLQPASDGGPDSLRIAEIALGSALAAFVFGGAALAFAGRRR